MPSFNEHISQSKVNLKFLRLVNSTAEGSFWDWQVTICFYVGVHLINAHLAKQAGLHYRKHEEVNNVISPYSTLSPCKLPEQVYLSYMKLQNLARRARYLVNEDRRNMETTPFFTYDKHLMRSLKHLDNLMQYMHASYSVNFDACEIKCMGFEDRDIKFFNKKN
jgi:galactokinase